MSGDLTAILIPQGQLDERTVWELVAKHRSADVLVRVAPLSAVGLTQIEVHDTRRGLPTEDPELVGRLSKGGKAVFVHFNHAAKQVMVHGFVDGVASKGFAGAPGGEAAAQLVQEVGAGLDAILAADDGSRIGFGVASSRTVAIVKGRVIAVPPGTPTGFNSFAFHDRGAGLDEGQERMALFAFDRARAFAEAGETWAARVGMAPAGAFGPLEGARAEAQAALAALGATSIAEARLPVQRALEVVAFGAALAWAGGEQVSYWDERVLPMFALLSGAEPPTAVIDAAEAEALDDDTEGLLHAMVETLPYAAPPGGEGALLSQLSPSETHPLSPWAAAAEHAGSIFILDAERLLRLVRRLDGPKLNAAVDSFARLWYRAARPGQPEGDALATWRQAKEEEGAADFERFIADWAELRATLEIAAANRLDVALLFYA
jgi:hypothetical protein